jgi:hypothetical protein
LLELRFEPLEQCKASAVAPAKPPMTSPLPSWRTLRALDLMMVWPIETWPSPPMATSPPLRTVRIVVPCQGPDDPAGPDSEKCMRWKAFVYGMI